MYVEKHKLGIGILAGLASAIFVFFVIYIFGIAVIYGSLTVVLLGFLLTFFVSTPIFFCAFGWGTASSVVAVLTAIIALCFILPPQLALTYGLMQFIPAAIIAWFTGLARFDEGSEKTIWFPLSSIYFYSVIIITLAALLNAYPIYNTPDFQILVDSLREAFTNQLQIMESQLAATSSISPSEAANFFTYAHELLDHPDFYKIVLTVVLLTSASTSLLFLLGNYYFATRIARHYGRLVRPHDDWPASLRLPYIGVSIFAIACLIGFILPNILLLQVFVSTLVYVFMLALFISGLAFIHLLTRQIPGRNFILVFTYFFSIWLWPIFVGLGIWHTFRNQITSNTNIE